MKRVLSRIGSFLSSITASQIKVVAASIVTYLYPGVNANLRAGIVGGLVGIYVMGTAIYKAVAAHKPPTQIPPNMSGVS